MIHAPPDGIPVDAETRPSPPLAQLLSQPLAFLLLPSKERDAASHFYSSDLPSDVRGARSLPWKAASSDGSAVDVRIVAADVDDDVSDADVN